jgi:hypothetical protein
MWEPEVAEAFPTLFIRAKGATILKCEVVGEGVIYDVNTAPPPSLTEEQINNLKYKLGVQ